MEYCPRKTIQNLADALVLYDEGYSWFGHITSYSDEDQFLKSSKSEQRDIAEFLLQQRLYEDFYTSGKAVPSAHFTWNSPRAEKDQFLSDLVNALPIKSRTNELPALSSEGDLKLCEYRGIAAVSTEPNSSTESLVSAKLSSWSSSWSPGFFYVIDDKILSGPICRIYLNIKNSACAVRFVQWQSEFIDQNQIPFEYKILLDPASYHRTDAAVIYLNRTHVHGAIQSLQKNFHKFRNLLGCDVPALTYPIAPGIGLAEEPEGGQSFGVDRTAALSRLFLTHYFEDGLQPSESFELVINRLDKLGICKDLPYRNAFSSLSILTPPLTANSEKQYSRSSKPNSAEVDEVLRSIADRIVRGAIWDGERCNWLRGNAFSLDQSGRFSSGLSALDASVYDGLAGIAYFLAICAKRFKDDEAYPATAIGALNSIKFEPLRAGFFTGNGGAAVIKSTVYRLLGLAEHTPLWVDNSLNTKIAEGDEFELLSGLAGSLLAQCLLHRLNGDQTSLKSIEVMIARLENAAKLKERGISWGESSFEDGGGMIGMAHGVAGVVYALAEAYRLRPSESLSQLIEGGVAYECSRFNFECGMWPYSGELSEGHLTRERDQSFVNHWCHGAPGFLALSNTLRGTRFFQKIRHLEGLAIEATKTSIINWLDNETNSNWSLCHGISGNTDLLLTTSMLRKDDALHKFCLDVAVRGLDRLTKDELGFRSGGVDDDDPTLMLGLSGMGLFLLRTVKPDLGSILAPASIFDGLEIELEA